MTGNKAYLDNLENLTILTRKVFMGKDAPPDALCIIQYLNYSPRVVVRRDNAKKIIEIL